MIYSFINVQADIVHVCWSGFTTRALLLDIPLQGNDIKYKKGIVMKKILFYSLICLTMIGCSKNDTVQFCEGVDMDGKGVNCGKKFTTGDLTGVMKMSKPFETEMVDVRVIRIEKNSKIVEKTIHQKVERDKNITSTPLSFYNSGKYVVELYRDKDKIAEGSIEITDIYYTVIRLYLRVSFYLQYIQLIRGAKRLRL